MRAEVRALEALLATVGVVLGDDPLPAPYIRVVPQRNADEQARLTGPLATEVIQVAIGSVGETRDQALWLDDRVDAVLRPRAKGVRLTVPGRSCSPIERRASDLSTDDSATRVWEAVTLYRFTSDPA